jgi:hypothetical protein
MQMHSLKKMGVWLTLATLTTGMAHAESLADRRGSHHSGKHHSSSHHSHSHRCVLPASRCDILRRGCNDLRLFVGDLNRIFLAEAISGLTPTDPLIASYVNAVNTAPIGSITTAAVDFGNLLTSLGVDQDLSNQVVAALDAYALAAENFSAAVVSGVHVSGTLLAWQVQANALAQALANASGVKISQLNDLIDQFLNNQATHIQAYNTANFTLAVEETARGFQLATEISDLVIGKLIRHCRE